MKIVLIAVLGVLLLLSSGKPHSPHSDREMVATATNRTVQDEDNGSFDRIVAEDKREEVLDFMLYEVLPAATIILLGCILFMYIKLATRLRNTELQLEEEKTTVAMLKEQLKYHIIKPLNKRKAANIIYKLRSHEMMTNAKVDPADLREEQALLFTGRDAGKHADQ